MMMMVIVITGSQFIEYLLLKSKLFSCINSHNQHNSVGALGGPVPGTRKLPKSQSL